MNAPTQKTRFRSLEDYIIRYDLKELIEEARLDYSQASAGGPRLLAQEDIAARFRRARSAAKPSHD